MIDPRSYTINLPNYSEVAFDGLQQGLKTAIAFGAQDMANQKAEMEARYAKQMQDDFATVAANPIRSTDDLVNLTLKYPDKAEQIKQSYDMLDATKQQAAFKTASRLYVGANSGRFDVVESILDTEISGYENAGETETANYLKQMKTLAQNNPEAFKNLTGFTLASTAPDKFKDILGATDQHEMLPEEINLKKAQTEKTETETKWIGPKTKAEIGKIEAETEQTKIENEWLPDEKQWNIENVQSQIEYRAGQLGLERDKLETNTQLKLEELGQSQAKLSSGAEKLVNELVTDSAAAQTQSQKLNSLADRYAKESQAGGWFTSGWAGFKRATGFSNDEQNAMMREYDRLINSEVLKALPPGPATDKDIEMARKGFPPSNADSTTITTFLRGVAKMSEVDAAHKQMKAEWVNQNGQLGSSKRDIEVLGVRVPKGTPFTEFYQKNLGRALKNQDKQSRSQQATTGQAIYFNISP